MSMYKDYGWENEGFNESHKYLLDPIIKLLPKDGSPILDLGCGNGAISNFLIKKGYNVYGTDASVSGIELAKKSNPQRFYLQDLSCDELPEQLRNIPFKTVISTEVIEHLYDPRKFVLFCKNILTTGGGG